MVCHRPISEALQQSIFLEIASSRHDEFELMDCGDTRRRRHAGYGVNCTSFSSVTCMTPTWEDGIADCTLFTIANISLYIHVMMSYVALDYFNSSLGERGAGP